MLQACCRCLREVEDAKKEKALIYLSPDNYQTLEQELKNNYRLTINDIQVKQENTISKIKHKNQLLVVKTPTRHSEILNVISLRVFAEEANL